MSYPTEAGAWNCAVSTSTEIAAHSRFQSIKRRAVTEGPSSFTTRYWLTDFPRQWVSGPALLCMAKSRWEIENQGFNDAKNRYGFDHICHHERHRLLVVWLLTCLALTIEPLYRILYLHRGTHPILQPISLWQLLWLSLSPPSPTTRARFRSLPAWPHNNSTPRRHLCCGGEVLLRMRPPSNRTNGSAQTLLFLPLVRRHLPKFRNR